jgi:carnitine 3-dehydrogenase
MNTKVACIGTGLIGGGWVVHYLARGYDVVAWDPDPGALPRLQRQIAAAWPFVTQLGLAPGASLENLRFASSLAEAVSAVTFIQESAPEILHIKQGLLKEITTFAPRDCIIGSSTSGLSMTQLQSDVHFPERIVAGHPFNPPYLIPLVEVCGGEQTSRVAIETASAFYRQAGKAVIQMDREVPGFIANRLQAAIWAEAMHMVAAGEATVEQIDAAVVQGPGLRWAIYGPCMTYHLAVSDGGIDKLLQKVQEKVYMSNTRASLPDLSTQLRQRLVQGCLNLQGNFSHAELIQQRDQQLVNILKCKTPTP